MVKLRTEQSDSNNKDGHEYALAATGVVFGSIFTIWWILLPCTIVN